MPQDFEINTIQNHPMKFYDIYEDITVELPISVPINLVKLELNKIIRRINDEIGQHRELIQVNTGALNTKIEDMTTTIIESETTYNIDVMSRFNFGWYWNTVENRLTLSDNVYEVYDVYIDEEEWTRVNYETVKSSDNTSEKYWTQVGRYLWFPLDIADETTSLRINCKRTYPNIENVINDQSVIDLPESYRQLLISGVLYNLTARPKYRDENIFAVNKQTFELEFQTLKDAYDGLDTSYLYETRETTYKY